MKTISGKRMCQVLEQNGWILRRISGSHHIYGKPGNSLILTIPVHSNQDLKRGLQLKVMKDAELTEDDL